MEKIQQELLRLEFPEVIQAREIQILWDSNLSREIMISLSDQKLKKQVKVGCDQIQLTIEKTHGTTQPKVFEVRVYQAGTK